MDDITLNPGEVIDDKYEIVSKLGQGSMGVVYKARALATSCDVAIKMLTHVDEETRKRFSFEAECLARFEHPAVVRVDEIGSSPKWGPYLVFAYIPGRDLDDVAQAKLPVEEAVSLTLAICSGVSACHSRSIVHRDLKPSNIRVTNALSWLERVRILDFGLALPFDSPIVKAHQLRQSQLGPVDEVSRYMAPELLRRERPTKQSDQYSIAALLYLMLTGNAPFDNFEGEELVRAIVLGQSLPPHTLRPDVPAGLEAAVLRGLDPNPPRRYPSVNELALALLPFGPPSLKSEGARCFTHANGQPIEPGSPCRGDVPMPLAPGNQPSPGLLPAPASAHPPPVPDDVTSTPIPELLPDDQPSTRRRAKRVPRNRWLHPNAVMLFTLGAALGSTIATIIFVTFLWYQQRHPQPCLPAPTTSHAATPPGPRE